MKKRAVRKRQRHVGNSPNHLNRNLPQQSEFARDRALHVLAAMRRDSSLSLSRAAKAEGVKPETVKKNFPLALRKSGGKFVVTKSDRYQATLYLPDASGNSVPLNTRSSRERKHAGQYLRDLGRYQRGQKDALAKWHGKKIAGVDLVTAGRTIVRIEPALSEFSLYRAFNGGDA
jgi:lipoate-protein ligase A